MSLKFESESLLKEHNELFFELIKIPEEREITFHIDNDNGHQIAKPRFQPPLYNWPDNILTRFRNHLQHIWNFFETYSYWFDDMIKPLINYDNQRISKNSIMFLLQQDTNETDEVYGEYLIEKGLTDYSISYYKKNQKLQTFKPRVNSKEKVEEWICLDSRRQIIDRFSFLWNYIQTEIESCSIEDNTRLPDKLLTSRYIQEQNNKISAVIEQYPELGLLKLGRIAELYLVQILKLENRPYNINLAWKAKNEGLITNQQMKTFESIRKQCNSLKHRLDYSVNETIIEQLWKNFSNIISNK